MKNFWEETEENFLKECLFEEPRTVYDKFLEKFGRTRSPDAVKRKVTRLRSEQEEVEDNNPLYILDPVIARQQADAWTWALGAEYSQYKYPIKIGRKSKKRSLIVVLSDIHWGKLTDKFNMDIADQRIMSLVNHLASSTLPEFDEIVVLLLGDLIEGEDIFPHQNGSIEAPVITASKRATETIWKFVISLRNYFSVPIRIETSAGNHGRMSKTANPKSNWDNVIYQGLALINKHSKEPGIIVNVNLNEFSVVDVKGVNILITHHGIKHLGTPAMIQKMAGWIISKDIDALVHGHWHTHSIDTYLGRTRISNGCVPGGDDLGERIAREDPARQVYFFVDPLKNGYIHGFDYLQWT